MRWNRTKIRAQVSKHLGELEEIEEQYADDHAGGEVPASLAVLFLLETIRAGDFFGAIEVRIKGRKVLRPEVSKQSFRMPDKYKEYLM